MQDELQKVIILGSGGHAKSCIDIASRMNGIIIIGCLDNEKTIGTLVCGVEVIGSDERILEFTDKETNFIIGVGQIRTPAPRISLFNKILENQGVLQNVVASSALISSNATLGKGVTIMEGAKIGPNVTLGDGVIINTNAVIEHDSVIDEFCHVSTGAIINGGCQIGKGTFIGSGTVVKQKINIGANCVIGMQQSIKNNLVTGSIVK